MGKEKLIIAIDGPAGSGKTTTAKLVAHELGYLHLDTGAMYRGVAEKVLRAGIDPSDRVAISRLVESTTVTLRQTGNGVHVLLDGEDVTSRIRGTDVTRIVSAVSSVPEVRRAMVSYQRSMGKDGGVVVEGRDIGTVVFPDAGLKIFLVADLQARAHRRQLELHNAGIEASLEWLAQEIQERDTKDSTRSDSPLQQASDAVVLDTSELTIAQQVEFIVSLARKRMQVQ